MDIHGHTLKQSYGKKHRCCAMFSCQGVFSANVNMTIPASYKNTPWPTGHSFPHASPQTSHRLLFNRGFVLEKKKRRCAQMIPKHFELTYCQWPRCLIDLNWRYLPYPLVMTDSLLLKPWHIEIVDLASYKMVDFSIVFCMFTGGYIRHVRGHSPWQSEARPAGAPSHGDPNIAIPIQEG